MTDRKTWLKKTNALKARRLARIIEMHAEGFRDPEIGLALGLSRQRVHQCRVEAGLPARSLKKAEPDSQPCGSCGKTVLGRVYCPPPAPCRHRGIATKLKNRGLKTPILAKRAKKLLAKGYTRLQIAAELGITGWHARKLTGDGVADLPESTSPYRLRAAQRRDQIRELTDEGLTAREVSERLGLSTSTVRNALGTE